MNEICYFEIISNDLAASQEFYGKAFGGELIPSGGEYVMWNLGAGIGAGLDFRPLEKCGPDANRTLVYVEVDDIQAMLTQAAKLGGTVVQGKTQISEEYGFYGLLRDPQGTLIGVWSKT